MTRLGLRRLAWLLAGGTTVVAVLGVTQVLTDGPRVLSLDYERTLPAFWSSALLLVAAAGALGLARDLRGSRWPWLSLAGLFAFMAIDEVVSVHERLERVAGVDWQTLYLPIALLAAAAGLTGLRRLWRERRALAILFALAGAAWLVSQGLEVVQWDGDRKVDAYETLMVVEEIGEMAGSVGFALCLFAWVPRPQAAAPTRPPRSAARPPSAPAAPPPRPTGRR